MSTNKRPPASLAGIKRLAKKIASEKSIQHTSALEEAARLAGYQTFLEARRALADQGQRPATTRPDAQPERQAPMSLSNFHERARDRWVNAINSVSAAGDTEKIWTDRREIIQILSPFMRTSNHALLPRIGGFDLTGVSFSRELGCLDFHLQGRMYLTLKPKRLVLERIEIDVAESFLLIDLEQLQPSGVYGEERNQRIRERRDEELVDIGEANYVGRDGLDEGYYYNESGAHELPDDYRRVKRLLDGKIMLLTKGSIWNGIPSTYLATHEQMSSSEIRRAIIDMIGIRDAA